MQKATSCGKKVPVLSFFGNIISCIAKAKQNHAFQKISVKNILYFKYYFCILVTNHKKRIILFIQKTLQLSSLTKIFRLHFQSSYQN